MFCASDDKYSPILAEERSNGEFHNIVAKLFQYPNVQNQSLIKFLKNADINWFIVSIIAYYHQ